MKYALAAAAMATAAAALPQDWAPVTTTANTWSDVESSTTASWSDVETSTTAAWSAYTTPAANTWSVIDTTTCYSTWTTKVCGGSGDWNNCNVETSTSTLYNDQCTWETVAATSTWAAAPVASTWAPAPVKVCTYVTVYEKSYTTKSCGSNSGAWDNCKDITTSSACTETVTDTSCTGTWGTWATPAAASTWSAAPVAPAKGSSWSAAPVAASSTWAPAPVAATSSVWAPVGKYTGAADKQAIGFGAAAIAAVAMML